MMILIKKNQICFVYKKKTRFVEKKKLDQFFYE